MYSVPNKRFHSSRVMTLTPLEVEWPRIPTMKMSEMDVLEAGLTLEDAILEQPHNEPSQIKLPTEEPNDQYLSLQEALSTQAALDNLLNELRGDISP